MDGELGSNRVGHDSEFQTKYVYFHKEQDVIPNVHNRNVQIVNQWYLE